ncbi:MAG: glycosyltransferase family 1 protein [Verrucomicrobiales bacterium]
MRIAIVSDTLPPDINGVAMTLGRLCRGLAGRGHRVQIVRPRPAAGAAGFDSRDLGAESEIQIASASVPLYPEMRFGFPCGFSLDRSWSACRPDAVYVATESPMGISAIRACRRLAIRAVSGFHTNFHSYLASYHLPFLESLADRYLRRLHNRTACTLAPSRDVARDLAGRGYENVALLQRGVDTALFDPRRRDMSLRAAWRAAEGDPVALYVGRIAAEKNLALAFEAARQRGLRMVAVGDGPERAALAREFPEVIFAGSQRGEDLARHYASADLFLFPSLSETFGNVVLEAMASGLVAVAFDYAAPAENIAEGRSGFLARYGSADSFHAACDRALAARDAYGADPRRRPEPGGQTRLGAHRRRIRVRLARRAIPAGRGDFTLTDPQDTHEARLPRQAHAIPHHIHLGCPPRHA